MRAAAKASYSNRGKQPIWFLYNTDLRAGGDTSWNSSYMTQLGAFPILDYTLDQGHIDEDWILSYYGASLSGWLIYNSGGYWSPDRENQGATGWITIASLINHTGQPPENSADRGMENWECLFPKAVSSFRGKPGLVSSEHFVQHVL